ncbi:hypothetical protein ACTMU2_39870 [Cupriavidus basilensis]
MPSAIVGLRMVPVRVEAKFKLSQNRPAADRARIPRRAARRQRDRSATWLATGWRG